MGEDLATQNQKISDNIREYGWHCLHVFPTKEGQDKFSYSIGFGESYGAPEILIFGLEREKAHALLNECAHLLRDGHTILPDAEDDNVLAGDYTVVFKTVRSESFGDYLGTAVRYYRGKPFNAVVMFLPDRQHRFPWQSGYDDIPAEEALAIV
jgi:hypothetical protein